jgi:hypothetical protein
MRARRGAAFTLVTLALALGSSGCGGAAATTTTPAAQVKAAVVHWRVGLGRWRASMQRALDGISLIFAREATMVELETRHSETSIRLQRYELTLTGCAVALRRIGSVPPPLRISNEYAGQACLDLERGARLVIEAVSELGRVTVADPLDRASIPLGIGQSELTTATRAAARLPQT